MFTVNNKKAKIKFNITFILGVMILIFVSGCNNIKRLAYLTDLTDSMVLDVYPKQGVLIEPTMQLNIQMASSSPDIDNEVNRVNSGVMSSSTTGIGLLGGTSMAGGYIVTDSGFIKVPRLGKIRVSGYTLIQLEDSLENWFSKYTKRPVVYVRLTNFIVTILGEVARTGAITITSEDVNILQVLGITGDLTLFGKRHSVTIIRNTPKGKTVKKLDLTKSDYISSEFFYCRPGDIIYVEPNMAKKFNSTLAFQMMPIVVSATSFVLLIFNLFR